METTSPPLPETPLRKQVHPLMSPEARRALWRSVQAVWKQPTAEVIADIEQSRREWDR